MTRDKDPRDDPAMQHIGGVTYRVGQLPERRGPANTWVKLKAKAPRGHEREHEQARRELSPTGVYRLMKVDTDDDGAKTYFLTGAMAPWSGELFEEVKS